VATTAATGGGAVGSPIAIRTPDDRASVESMVRLLVPGAESRVSVAAWTQTGVETGAPAAVGLVSVTNWAPKTLATVATAGAATSPIAITEPGASPAL